ncbi:MAG: ATP-binding cassette domain-containing protein [Proteobacteria bacterium]|nr:ATP-binding cassette domain-containing protein [Pseudomonadota bacterium]
MFTYSSTVLTGTTSSAQHHTGITSARSADRILMDFSSLTYRIDQCIDQVGLVSKRNAMAGTLSLGMKQRLVIAKTLLPEPEVLLENTTAALSPEPEVEVDQTQYLCPQCGTNHKRVSAVGKRHAHLFYGGQPEVVHLEHCPQLEKVPDDEKGPCNCNAVVPSAGQRAQDRRDLFE